MLENVSRVHRDLTPTLGQLPKSPDRKADTRSRDMGLCHPSEVPGAAPVPGPLQGISSLSLHRKQV